MSVLSLFCTLAAATIGFGAPGESYHQGFRAGAPDPQMLEIVGLDHGVRLDSGSEGITFTIPAGGRVGDSAGVLLRPLVRGDFVISASYDLVRAGPPRDGYGAGLGLMIETASGEKALTIERISHPSEGENFTSTLIFEDSAGQKQYRPERVKASARRGRIRVSRIGSMVEAWFADDNEDYQLLRKVELGNDDLGTVRLGCYTGQSDCEVVATLRDLMVDAAELPRRVAGRTRQESRPGVWKSRLALITLANLGLVLALLAWRKPQMASRVLSRPAVLRRRGAVRPVVAGLVIVTLISAAAHRRAISENYVHEDERIWTACSYFYRLVLTGDFEHPLWSGFDGIDAPHVEHFLIGASLRVAGLPVPEVPSRGSSWDGLPLPSGALLRAARMPGLLLGVGLAPLVFLVTFLATGRWLAGLVAGLIYALHPLALLSQARAMSEPPFMFFTLAAMLTLAWACRRDDGGARASLFGRSGLINLGCGPILLGLATGSKLTGIFIAATSLLTLSVIVLRGCFGPRVGLKSWAIEGTTYVALFGCLTVTWTVLCNPTLYPEPVTKFREMLDHRVKIGATQRDMNPQWAVTSNSERLEACYRRVAAESVGPAAFPLFLLCGLGVASMVVGEARRVTRGQPFSPAVAILAWVILLFAGMLPTLPLNWERYYLPFVPLWAIGIGAAVTTILDRVRFRSPDELADSKSSSVQGAVL